MSDSHPKAFVTFFHSGECKPDVFSPSQFKYERNLLAGTRTKAKNKAVFDFLCLINKWFIIIIIENVAYTSSPLAGRSHFSLLFFFNFTKLLFFNLYITD